MQSIKELSLAGLSVRIVMLLFFIIIPLNISSAQDKLWNGKKCAVALTYDDALDVHLSNVIPALDSAGFKGTFYLSGYFPGFYRRIKDWKHAAVDGHELGNHTLFHPCEGKTPGREWVNPQYDLNNYSVERITDEIKMMNIVLKSLDEKINRTFAYPCGDKIAGDSSYVKMIKGEFTGARSVSAEMKRKNEIDLFDIPSYMINSESGDELKNLVKEALNKNALLVFLFHGVGGEHSLNVSLPAHRELISYLKENEKDIWVAPLNEIAEYIMHEYR